MAKNRADSMPAIGAATTQVRQSSVPAVTRARLRARRIRRHRRARCGSRNALRPGMRTRRDEPRAPSGAFIRGPTDRIRRPPADGMRRSRPLATARGWPGRRRPPRLGWRRSGRWLGRARSAADCGGCHARWAYRSWRGARRRGLAPGRAGRQEAPGIELLGAGLVAVRARVSRRCRPGGAATSRPLL